MSGSQMIVWKLMPFSSTFVELLPQLCQSALLFTDLLGNCSEFLIGPHICLQLTLWRASSASLCSFQVSLNSSHWETLTQITQRKFWETFPSLRRKCRQLITVGHIYPKDFMNALQSFYLILLATL